MLNNIIKEARSNPVTYLLLFVVLAGALYIRVYRIDMLLGFYYDQGRDALIIWDFIHEGNLFLIGPTTGIEGIFRGPWYYWLITPAYFIGNGNPIFPSIFLSILAVLGILVAFIIGKEIGGRSTGLIAAIIASFSYYLMLASRWLSNPTPMLLIGPLLVWSLYETTRKKLWAWPAVGFLIGMAMQFGSAAEFFYIPAVLVFAFIKRKSLPSRKIVLLSFFLFMATFIPQIIFDVIKGGVLSSAIKKFLFEDESFKLSFWEIVKVRLPFYYNVFTTKISPGPLNFHLSTMVLAAVLLIVNFKKLWREDIFKVLIILLVSPLIGMLFFQGNYGNVYDYYFTGYYLIFVLLLATSLGMLARSWGGRVLLAFFLIAFFQANIPAVKGYIRTGVDGPGSIALGNQLQSLDWVFEDAGKQEFNVDVYVPPVIPYAYDYLFRWYGTTKWNYVPSQERVPLLYTLYEADHPHPERLEAWLGRQRGIGKVEREVRFGAITVQRRLRL